MDNRLERAGGVDATGSVLTAEVSARERGTFVDVVITQWTLPARGTLTQEAVVLVQAGRSVTTRVAQTLAHCQQLHRNAAPRSAMNSEQNDLFYNSLRSPVSHYSVRSVIAALYRAQLAFVLFT